MNVHSARVRVSGGTTSLRSDEVARDAVRLVVIDRASDNVRLARFAQLPELVRAGDLIVVNDAASLPASLPGRTARGEPFELRLSAPVDGNRLFGVVLGPGDHTTRTEHRVAPPTIVVGDRVSIARLVAVVAGVAGRRVELVTRGSSDALWQAVYAFGQPVQYAHRVGATVGRRDAVGGSAADMGRVARSASRGRRDRDVDARGGTVVDRR